MNEVEQLANKKFEDWKESFIRLLKEEIDVWAYDNTARWGISVVDIIDLKGKIQNLAGSHFHSPQPTSHGGELVESSIGTSVDFGSPADKSQSSEGVKSGHRSPEMKPASDSGADVCECGHDRSHHMFEQDKGKNYPGVCVGKGCYEKRKCKKFKTKKEVSQ